MRKQWKKAVAAAAATAMAVSLTACSGGSGQGGDAQPAEAGAGDGGKGKTLNVAIWDSGQKSGLDQIIADYTAATGNKAEIQVVTWDQYWTLLEAGASGGDLPDVFWMHSNEAERYMRNDILMDLTDRIASSEKLEMEKFPAEIKELYQYEGKTYAIPKDVDTIALFYNKALFDEAGLSYPDESWTWDDYYDAAVALTKEDGSQYGTAMSPTNNQDGWMNMVYSMGGKVISDDKKTSGFDDPATVKAMEYVDRLVKDGMPPASVMAENANDVMLGSGKIAMLPLGSWMIAPMKTHEYISQNCAVSVLPKDKETGRRVSIYNGLGWAVSAKTENPEAAWQLVEWFGSREGQTRQAELGVSMSAYEGVSDGWKANTDAFDLQPYLDMREDVVFRPYSSSTVTWENQITEDLKEAWNGNCTMAEACSAVTEHMNAILAEEN